MIRTPRRTCPARLTEFHHPIPYRRNQKFEIRKFLHGAEQHTDGVGIFFPFDFQIPDALRLPCAVLGILPQFHPPASERN